MTPAPLIESTAQNFKRLKTNVCHRSSAVFFVQNGGGVRTTLSFLNHFLLKRGIESGECRVTVRGSAGRMIVQWTFPVRGPRTFEVGFDDLPEFVGSAELEFFSQTNLVIPYSAVMAVYVTQNGFCQLHACCRTYNAEELERGVVKVGAESGWTLRDAGDVESFAVIHNGATPLVGDFRLKITNSAGEVQECLLENRLVPAFAMQTIIPREHCDLVSFLGGQPGHCSVYFPVETSFPRSFCGNRRMSGGRTIDLQATHTNFDYSHFDTPRLAAGEPGYTYVPHAPDAPSVAVAVYPNFADTTEVTAEHVYGWASVPRDRRSIIPARQGEAVVFTTEDPRGLPNRIIDGLEVPWSNRIPAEASYGILTDGYAGKSWHWGLAHQHGAEGHLSGFFWSSKASSRADERFDLKLYDEQGECGGAVLQIKDFEKGIRLKDIERRATSGAVFWRVKSDYPLAQFLTFLYDRSRTSGGIEHSF
jgi:hypothetical protein